MFSDLLVNVPIEEESNGFDYNDYLVSTKEVNKDLENFVLGNVEHGYKIGIPALDNYWVSKKNEMYLLTGKKGMGKTTVNQALQVMHSIVNDLVWVVAFQENSHWSMKYNYMNYLTGCFAKDLIKNDIVLYNKALEWIDKHFIFIEVGDIKTAVDVTKGVIENGVDVHALLLDPINSFRNGWQDTGNGYSDGTVSATEILKFSKKYCSVHISQHPNMSAQRQEGNVTSSQGEGGWYLNKASFTYTINRKKGSNLNELTVENIRNKHTGGDESDIENPVVLEWYPTSINIGMLQNMENKYVDVIGYLRHKHNPLNEKGARFEKGADKFKELPSQTVVDAFGIEEVEEELPF